MTVGKDRIETQFFGKSSERSDASGIIPLRQSSGLI